MKRLSKLLLITAILFLGFNSCEREKLEVAGEIPGMGNSDGILKAKVYDFHKDLVFSPIIGVGERSKSGSVVIEGVAQGSGDMVTVTFTITNENLEEWRSVYFRAGTVFQVNLPGYQNAILLAPVVICISPGEERIVTLFLYCLNYGKSDSDNSASYEILGVTQSELMLQLVNALQGKMVNYEDYMLYYGEGAFEFYTGVEDRLQEIVWHITNGQGMTQADKDYVAGLPLLPPDVLPKGIYDLGYVLPASWCDGCRLETAWGGNEMGLGSAWWFYYDATADVPGMQPIYAGQHIAAGAYVEYINGEIRINLGGLKLSDHPEAVKIQGYSASNLPKDRPAPGLFATYKGTKLTVPVPEYDYYAIHLEVGVCN